MTDRRTKAAFMLSLVSLMLCIAMLAGTTFAWFTDTATSGSNKIVAGNLDVALYQLQGSEYVDISTSKTAIFNYDKWEPGYSSAQVVQVKNEGNLALKFKVTLVSQGTIETNTNGHRLTDAIDVYAKISSTAIASAPSSLADATSNGYANVGTLTSLIDDADGIAYGAILPAGQTPSSGEVVGSVYVGLILHMREDAGNEYKEMSIGTGFDIQVEATQYSYESDSFNNQYDKNATGGSTPDTDNNPYLTFSSDKAFTLGTTYVGWTNTATAYLEISTNGTDWTKWTGTDVDAVENDNTYYVYLRGDGMTALSDGGNRVTTISLAPTQGKLVDCSGNIMTLLDYDNPNVTMGNYAFYTLFAGCTALQTAPTLSATTLSMYCYAAMFSDCTSLTEAPVLPATTLASGCYYGMFNGCTSLTTAPELNSTALAEGCYADMFNGCTSLTEAPALPATTLAAECYMGMFSGCTKLTVAPEIKATTLAKSCCVLMFSCCTALTTAPELKATTLADTCYKQMFKGCTKLTKVYELPAIELTKSCYEYMFGDCTSLKVAEITYDNDNINNKIFKCPEIPTDSNAVTDMFKNTAGDFKGTPTKDNTYLWYAGQD